MMNRGLKRAEPAGDFWRTCGCESGRRRRDLTESSQDGGPVLALIADRATAHDIHSHFWVFQTAFVEEQDLHFIGFPPGPFDLGGDSTSLFEEPVFRNFQNAAVFRIGLSAFAIGGVIKVPPSTFGQPLTELWIDAAGEELLSGDRGHGRTLASWPHRA